MKKILSVLLAISMLLSISAFVVSADSTPNISLERTLDIINASNGVEVVGGSLYRFKATDIPGTNVKYEWTIKYTDTSLNLGDKGTRASSRNYFGFFPPEPLTTDVSFTVEVKVTIDDQSYIQTKDFILSPILKEEDKEALRLAILDASFRNEGRYTPESWNVMLGYYNEACKYYKDKTLSTGTTIAGGKTDLQLINDTAANLYEAATRRRVGSGMGLNFAEGKEDGIVGMFYTFLENFGTIMYGLLGVKIGGLELPFESGGIFDIIGGLGDLDFSNILNPQTP